MTEKKPFLSVIIPAYNEMQNLKRGVLEEVWRYLERQKYDYEVILSDDESTDQTLATMQNWVQGKKPKAGSVIRVLANKHGGKAPTVTAGMLAAAGDWRLFTDFDQSTPVSEVEKLLKYRGDGYGIIFGSREIEGSGREKEPWYRHLMGRGFNLLVRILAVPKVQDTQCGFKMFSAEATKALFPALYVYTPEKGKKDAFTGAFDVELFYLARKIGIKYKEVGVKWKHNKTDRVSPIKDSWRMLMDILKIRMADFGGKYVGSLRRAERAGRTGWATKDRRAVKAGRKTEGGLGAESVQKMENGLKTEKKNVVKK